MAAARQLPQSELAAKIEKSQSMVSGSEAGRIRVNDRYVALVFKACGLPKEWSGAEPAAAKRKKQSSVAA